MLKKGLILLISFIFITSITACGYRSYKITTIDSIKRDYEDAENFKKDYAISTPEYSIQISLKALKDLDFETFNIYTDNLREENNKFFSDSKIDEQSREFFESLFKKLDFEIKNTEINGNKAIVNVNISNLNLTDVISEFTLEIMKESIISSENLLNSSEKYYLDKLKETINKKNREVKVENLDLILNKDNDVWILHINNDFVNASCGGMFQNFTW